MPTNILRPPAIVKVFSKEYIYNNNPPLRKPSNYPVYNPKVKLY